MPLIPPAVPAAGEVGTQACHDNLGPRTIPLVDKQRLRGQNERGFSITWSGPRQFTVDGEAFTLVGAGTDKTQPGDPEQSLFLWKSAAMVDDLAEVLSRFRGGNIVELGVFTGGSVALTALLAQPERMVAIERLSETTPHLARFIERRGLEASVRPYWQVDQADGDRLREIVASEFGETRLDVVYDDASHVYAPTRASFEELFPRLRPGGLFILEDWPNEQGFLTLMREHHGGAGDPAMAGYVAELTKRLGMAVDDPSDGARHGFARFLVENDLGHLIGRSPAGETCDEAPFVPLIRLVHELVQLRGEHEDIVRSISLTRDWAVVERGSADLGSGPFRIADHIRDDFGVLGSTT